MVLKRAKFLLERMNEGCTAVKHFNSLWSSISNKDQLWMIIFVKSSEYEMVTNEFTNDRSI
jgi:hypothetical protein